jgi:hypothetical protein
MKYFKGTETECNEIVAAADTYYGYPNAATKTLTWATPERDPNGEDIWCIPMNDWMLENLTYNEEKIQDEYPFPMPPLEEIE